MITQHAAPLPQSTPTERHIDQLMADPAFMARYTHFDLRIRAQAMEEMEYLSKRVLAEKSAAGTPPAVRAP
ncbi:MAG: hypothetical protein IOC63_09600 [Methylobacterium sp.]|nr:hypothetical protein [Methylobacterium sp.]